MFTLINMDPSPMIYESDSSPIIYESDSSPFATGFQTERANSNNKDFNYLFNSGFNTDRGPLRLQQKGRNKFLSGGNTEETLNYRS